MLQSFPECNPLNLHRSGDKPLSPTLPLLEGTHNTIIRSRKQETSTILQLVQEGVASHGYSRCTWLLACLKNVEKLPSLWSSSSTPTTSWNLLESKRAISSASSVIEGPTVYYIKKWVKASDIIQLIQWHKQHIASYSTISHITYQKYKQNPHIACNAGCTNKKKKLTGYN